MALAALTEDGYLDWICLHCHHPHTAHISHEKVEYPAYDEMETLEVFHHTDEQGHIWTTTVTRPTGRRVVYRETVALPPCDCGCRIFLKVTFTEAELSAPNMIHPVTRVPTPSYAVAHRHMELARRMEVIGKHLAPSTQPEQQKELVMSEIPYPEAMAREMAGAR